MKTYELALMEREELGEKRGREKATLANLNSVMKKLNFSVEKAMEFLEIPKEEQNHYLSLLKT